jgi:hypothetical protein
MPTIVNIGCCLLLFWAVAAEAALPDVTMVNGVETSTNSSA